MIKRLFEYISNQLIDFILSIYITGIVIINDIDYISSIENITYKNKYDNFIFQVTL